MINKETYNTNDKKIAFMLSYMTDKEALQWKELYLEALTNQTTGDIVFSTYAKFLDELKEAFKFKAADWTGKSMNKLTNLRQGNRTAEELATGNGVQTPSRASRITENHSFRQPTFDRIVLKCTPPCPIPTNSIWRNRPNDLQRLGQESDPV